MQLTIDSKTVTDSLLLPAGPLSLGPAEQSGPTGWSSARRRRRRDLRRPRQAGCQPPRASCPTAVGVQRCRPADGTVHAGDVAETGRCHTAANYPACHSARQLHVERSVAGLQWVDGCGIYSRVGQPFPALCESHSLSEEIQAIGTRHR